jgi:hypothetical protein
MSVAKTTILNVMSGININAVMREKTTIIIPFIKIG